ncbi:HAD-IA family hydrolase [Candidatus Pacearchaeota archaeon]|nr:HAD-IA family hydrolase [Candidatus Pacearchaeota archaeon]
MPEIKSREELIKAYINFFVSKNHREIPSASLIPENDPTVLFTTAGMHPLVPFLIGRKHPMGDKLVNVQKCIRTQDIEDVGDEVHHTFFEMLGNWGLGSYWKKEAIKWTYEFFSDVLGFSKERIAVSCFGGDENVAKDEESAAVWKSLGVPEERIAFLGRKDNWWGPAGETGPCGPDTEIFVWTGKEKASDKFDVKNKVWVEVGNNVLMQYDKIKIEAILVDAINCLISKDGKLNEELAKFLEATKTKIIVTTNADSEKIMPLLKDYKFEIFSLMKKPEKSNPEYFKKLLEKYKFDKNKIIYFDHKTENIFAAEKLGIKSELYLGFNEIRDFIIANLYKYKPLSQKNVDFGGGVERTLAVLNGENDDYETSIFKPIIEKIEKISRKKYQDSKKEMRIIADHLRAAVFILGDSRGIKPGNVGQGYILRRLIRRAVRHGRMLGIEKNFTKNVVEVILPIYPDYSELKKNKEFILFQLDEEEKRFGETLEKGLKKFENIVKGTEGIISGKSAFLLFQSYGFPIEMTVELAREEERKVDIAEFKEEEKRHQELSRTAGAGMFKSGLSDNSEKTTRLHTSTHLLNEALRKVLGKEIKQRGSNITPERLRFDFSFSRKMTAEEIKKVEDLVNEKIRDGLKVERGEKSLEEAIESGAQAEFGAKYPDIVSVYTILDFSEKKGWFSKEICTGPHVSNTREIGRFKIVKEENVAAGVRRIKAVVEKENED